MISDPSLDTIILDDRTSGFNYIDILKKIKTKNMQKRFFIISGMASVVKNVEEQGLSGLLSGIISEPIDLQTLLGRIKSV